MIEDNDKISDEQDATDRWENEGGPMLSHHIMKKRNQRSGRSRFGRLNSDTSLERKHRRNQTPQLNTT